MLKTHNCGELRIEDAGQRVTLAGWVHRHRSHGGVLFINLRDRSGLVQVTFNQRTAPEAHAAVEQARAEWVLQVEGTVQARPAGSENPDMPTGEIEVAAEIGDGFESIKDTSLPTSTGRLARLRHCDSSSATWTCAGSGCSAI